MELEVVSQILKALLEYGVLSFGWILFGWFLYKDVANKDAVEKRIQVKVEEHKLAVELKDQYIKELNMLITNLTKEAYDQRIIDLKDMSKELSELVSNVEKTLDKLIIALKVKID